MERYIMEELELCSGKELELYVLAKATTPYWNLQCCKPLGLVRDTFSVGIGIMVSTM